MLGEEVVPVLRKEFAALRARARARRADARQPGRRAGGGTLSRSTRHRRRRGGGCSMTTTRTLAVVSAGLSQPSSTRLLADRLAAATARALGRTRRRSTRRRDGRAARPSPTTSPTHLLTGFADRRADAASSTRSPAPTGVIAVTPIFTALLQRAVQVVLRRRSTSRRARRQAGADRRDRRHRPALAGARARAAAAVRLPARGRRPDRGVRRDRGLGPTATARVTALRRPDRAGAPGELADAGRRPPSRPVTDPFDDADVRSSSCSPRTDPARPSAHPPSS